MMNVFEQHGLLERLETVNSICPQAGVYVVVRPRTAEYCSNTSHYRQKLKAAKLNRNVESIGKHDWDALHLLTSKVIGSTEEYYNTWEQEYSQLCHSTLNKA